MFFSSVFSKFETDSVALRNHAHDTDNVNSQYPADRVLPIPHLLWVSTGSPGHPFSVADPWRFHPLNYKKEESRVRIRGMDTVYSLKRLTT